MLPVPVARKHFLCPTVANIAAADGKPIQTYGEMSTHLVIIDLNKKFSWRSVVADISVLLLGLEVLERFKLIIDCYQKRLTDSITKLQTSKVYNEEVVNINFQNEKLLLCVKQLLSKYPHLTSPTDLYLSNNLPHLVMLFPFILLSPSS